MPLKYLDTTYNYSDPATTNLKYLRRVDLPDGTHTTKWDAPSDRYKFYDSEGRWSVPELIPDLSWVSDWNSVSWDEINRFGQGRVLKNPDKYSHLLHMTKAVPLSYPLSKEIVFEIVDICHTDWGDDHAFVWMPMEECLASRAHQSTEQTNWTYHGSKIRDALMSGGNLFKTFPADLKIVWKDITYKYLTKEVKDVSSWAAGGTATTEKAKLVIPSAVEVGVSGSNSEYAKEGTLFQTFTTGTGGNAYRIRNGNGAAVGWWLRSFSAFASTWTYFIYINNKGVSSAVNGANGYQWVCPCFAV